MQEQRDLSFVSVTNDRPQRLSAAQIGFYNEHGYLRPFLVYDDNGAARNRDYFDSLLQQLTEQRDGRDAYAINGYHVRCAGIWDIVMNPLILDLVEDLIGPNIIAWGTHYFCKLPGDAKVVPWHQDASYWPLTPARTVTAWLAIDDADAGNAAMQFIPGTHRLGPLEWKNTEKPAVLHQEIVDIGRYGPSVIDELKAGEMSLHADMLAHGSPPNPSPRRRCGLTIRYCPPDVRALNSGWTNQAILCRGRDRDSHWTHNSRPEGDDMSLPNKPRSIGAN